MKSTLTLDIRSYTKQDILNNQTNLDLLSSLYKLELVSKINMPTRKRIWTVLSGPHVHKKSREQFQLSSYKRLLDIYSSTPKTIDALMKLELPSGVEVEIKV